MDKDGIQQKDVSARTVSCFLNSQNYYYLQTRKKGLMTAEDHIKRVKFAKYMKANYSQEIWTEGIAFYLNGTGFTHKRNPLDQAVHQKLVSGERNRRVYGSGMHSKGPTKRGLGAKYYD